MVKRMVIEKIEDEIDFNAVKKFENLEKTRKLKLRPIEKLWEEIGINDQVENINVEAI